MLNANANSHIQQSPVAVCIMRCPMRWEVVLHRLEEPDFALVVCLAQLSPATLCVLLPACQVLVHVALHPCPSRWVPASKCKDFEEQLKEYRCVSTQAAASTMTPVHIFCVGVQSEAVAAVSHPNGSRQLSAAAAASHANSNTSLQQRLQCCRPVTAAGRDRHQGMHS